MVNEKDKGAKEEDLEKFVTEELGKHKNKEELGKAYNYLLKRADGKYGFYCLYYFRVTTITYRWSYYSIY
jgi:hypothetical protein